MGQNELEEINLVTNGGNYGWNRKEAFACFKSKKCSGNYIDPVWSYPRTDGISITGGYVYRGKQHKKLNGYYVFADFAYGNIWGLKRVKNKNTSHCLLYKNPQHQVASFGENHDGELYFSSWSRGDILSL